MPTSRDATTTTRFIDVHLLRFRCLLPLVSGLIRVLPVRQISRFSSGRWFEILPRPGEQVASPRAYIFKDLLRRRLFLMDGCNLIRTNVVSRCLRLIKQLILLTPGSCNMCF